MHLEQEKPACRTPSSLLEVATQCRYLQSSCAQAQYVRLSNFMQIDSNNGLLAPRRVTWDIKPTTRLYTSFGHSCNVCLPDALPSNLVKASQPHTCQGQHTSEATEAQDLAAPSASMSEPRPKKFTQPQLSQQSQRVLSTQVPWYLLLEAIVGGVFGTEYLSNWVLAFVGVSRRPEPAVQSRSYGSR